VVDTLVNPSGTCPTGNPAVQSIHLAAAADRQLVNLPSRYRVLCDPRLRRSAAEYALPEPAVGGELRHFEEESSNAADDPNSLIHKGLAVSPGGVLEVSSKVARLQVVTSEEPFTESPLPREYQRERRD
jgi:hypothetical protein